jgi:GDP-L-fucose synthase
MKYTTSVTKSQFAKETQEFFNGKKVLITGGSGFIGSHVVEQLLALNARPVVPSRQSSPEFLKHLKPGSVEIKTCDLTDFASTRRAFEGCHVVMNLAAQVAGIEYNKNHPASIFQENLQVFFNVIRVSLRTIFSDELGLCISSVLLYSDPGVRGL